jgi:hypothetical protein
MEDVKSTSGQNLGIAALITAIITFVLAVIPCVGVIAIVPGIIAIVLASVALSQASRSDAPKGMIVAGLVIGIVALIISFSQVFVAGRIASKADSWPADIRSAIEEVRRDVLKDFEDANVSIKVERGGDVVEINAKAGKKDDMEKTLEDLESGKQVNDTIKDNK